MYRGEGAPGETELCRSRIKKEPPTELDSNRKKARNSELGNREKARNSELEGAELQFHLQKQQCALGQTAGKGQRSQLIQGRR